MSDAVFMDFEEPSTGKKGSHPWDSAPKRSKSRRKGGKKASKDLVPRLPTPEKPLTGDEVRQGVSNRARAVARYRTLGYSFQEIADEMGLADAKEAQRIHYSVIAATASPEEIEVHRANALSRAEMLFKQSIQMATATHLVLDDGTKVANEKQLQWHQQAASDMMNIATLTGAKAPTKVEFTPGEAEMERIVGLILGHAGHEDILDAEVIELDAVPDVDRDGDDWDADEVRG